ncbi:MAG: hypothetical protein U5K37_11785 [Natrialbaceae archaeon]|nr:hypothetical protein [Natrialbaceae archaeon]
MRTTEILDGDDVVQAMNDGLLFILQQAFNQQEIVQISSRIRQGLAEKQRREEPIGRPPFGLTTDKQRDNEDIATEFVPDENFETGLSILDAFDEAAGITPESDQSPSAYEVGKRHGLSSPSKLVEWIWDRRDLYRETDSEVGSS